MLEPEDPEGFATLIAKIASDSGFRCASYKERCLRRRIAVRMRARGVHTYDDYGRLLDGDACEYERLVDALTINVTKLYRNPETWAALAHDVVPALWAPDAPALRVWSAGCASGEEPYSLAILFAEHARALGGSECDAARLARVRVVGSDIDRRSLDAAVAGCYAEAAFAEMPAALRERYFDAGWPARVRPAVRELVAFERRDLLHEPPPHEALHLIVCRNVLIYFDRDTQERILRTFHAALAPGGFLVLGKVETLLGDSRRGFEPVVPRERIFRRT